MRTMVKAALGAGLLLAAVGTAWGTGMLNGLGIGQGSAAQTVKTTIPLTITSQNGTHKFTVEVARTPAEQERGLMFRTDIPKDGGMIFTPYPAAGGGPKEASFWMKNTPTSLDIIFIRPDGTIARIAENTVPFSEQPVPSLEPVSAVLELVGGRAAELGIAEGDKGSWKR